MEPLSSKLKEIKAVIKNWWVFAVLGLLFIALGIYVFNQPAKTFLTLSVFFAASILVSGIFQLWFAYTNRDEIEGWGWQLALAIMEVIIGIILFSNIGLTVVILPLYVGFWLLFRAFALVGFSFELKSFGIEKWWLYLIFGILLGLFSWCIILNPAFGGLTIVSWVGIALIMAGIAHVFIALKMKQVKKKMVNLKEHLSPTA